MVHAGWWNEHGDQYAFAMERVRGGAQLPLWHGWENAFERVLAWLDETFAASPEQHFSGDLFLNKLNTLARHPSMTWWASEVLVVCAERYRDGVTLPASFEAHGDLTLTNVLVNTDGVYFIDFLDSFLASPVADVAKLHQDTRYRWITRFGNVPNDRLDRLHAMLRDAQRAWPAMAEVPYLSALGLVRALPYATDTQTKNFLDKAIRDASGHLDVCRAVVPLPRSSA